MVNKRCLEPLEEGDTVLVQNQYGPSPKRWERTGEVVEKLGNRQYTIRMHGSGRVTLRNRRFLKKIQPLNPALTESPTPGQQRQPPAHQQQQPASQQEQSVSQQQPSASQKLPQQTYRLGFDRSERQAMTPVRQQPPRAAKAQKGGMNDSYK